MTAPVQAPTHDHRITTVVYIAAAGLASALLFLVEPLVVRMVLPDLGGSPAVWNTAMVFFQFALLIGYLLAHAGRRTLPWSSRPWIQIAFVAVGVLVLPVSIPMGWVAPPTGQTMWLLGLLVIMLGLPFVALSTLSPTLQGWLADTTHPRSDEPYFLYAAGNVGSVVGLLGYPLVVEPLLGLRQQALYWTVGYATLVVLLAAAALLRHRTRRETVAAKVGNENAPAASAMQERDAGPKWRQRMRWTVAAAVPSGLLLAVTQFISTDVASIPLLWVVPLTIYLATFVVAFAKPIAACPPIVRTIALASVVPVMLSIPIGLWSSWWLVIGIAVHLAGFGMLIQAVHFELAALRPNAWRLTEFYVWVSIGGLVGGVAVALVAPLIFNDVIEYPLLLAAALVVLRRDGRTPERTVAATGIFVGLIAAAAAVSFLVSLGVVSQVTGILLIAGAALFVVLVRWPQSFIWLSVGILGLMAITAVQPTLHQTRSFFGVLKVTEVDGFHRLVHGSTTHGQQQFEPEISTVPTIYYEPDGGVGRLMRATDEIANRRTAVVGLGAGTLASYNDADDEMWFYEIDQAVVDIAEDPAFFTFLDDASGLIVTEVVDGRVGMAESGGGFDVVVLDAFSSDAIPIHLLTSEAIAMYIDRMEPTGAIAVHITNRYFDLEPIVARVGGANGLVSYSLTTKYSTWIVLVDEGQVDGSIAAELATWKPIAADPGTPLWTDDYANLLSAIEGF